MWILWYFNIVSIVGPHADQVALREEGIELTSRVFFSESSRRVSSNMLDSDVPSVNFRGLMDPVRSQYPAVILLAKYYYIPTIMLHQYYFVAVTIPNR